MLKKKSVNDKSFYFESSKGIRFFVSLSFDDLLKKSQEPSGEFVYPCHTSKQKITEAQSADYSPGCQQPKLNIPFHKYCATLGDRNTTLL